MSDSNKHYPKSPCCPDSNIGSTDRGGSFVCLNCQKPVQDPFDGGIDWDEDYNGTFVIKSIEEIVFDTAWDLMKFWDNCPVCLGDAGKCPAPQLPMHQCPTRKNAMKHMKRGKKVRPPEREY